MEVAQAVAWGASWDDLVPGSCFRAELRARAAGFDGLGGPRISEPHALYVMGPSSTPRSLLDCCGPVSTLCARLRPANVALVQAAVARGELTPIWRGFSF